MARIDEPDACRCQPACAIGAGTGEPVVGQIHLFQLVADDFEHRNKLAEEQHFVAFGVELLEEFECGGELGAFLVFGGFLDEAGMAADLPQTRQCLQNGEAAAVHHVKAGTAEHEVLRTGEFFLVQLGLAAAHLAEHVFLAAGGQVAGHLAFGTAQQEGAQTRGEAHGDESTHRQSHDVHRRHAQPLDEGDGDGVADRKSVV